MIIGLNAATISKANLLQGLEATARAGFQAFEPRIPLLGACEERALDSLQRFGLRWLPLNSVEGVFSLPEEQVAEEMRKACVLANRFKIPGVIVVPGPGPSPEVNSAVTTLRRLREIGATYGVSILYEMLGFPGFAFANLVEAWKVVSKAGLPIVLDTFHLAVARARAEEIAKLPREGIGLVHLSDALILGKVVEELTDADRVLPGEGGLPLVELMTAIGRTGYRGPVSVEVFHPKYGEQDPYTTAQDAYRRARELLTEAQWHC